MMTDRTSHITLSAPFIAMGVLLPVLFHSVGLGPMFLPMFWPVAISAFFLPIPYAGAVGLLTPLVSSFITGMPPPPILYKMIFELAILAFIIRWFYQKTRYGLFWILAAGLIVSVLAGFAGSMAVSFIVNLPPELYALVTLVRGFPGIAVMFVILPAILKRIKREPLFGFRNRYVKNT
jgi:hypothetical protein